MPSLDIISVNIWQIIISLCNLAILFWILKKFLYKPVRATLQKRQDALDEKYHAAEEAEKNARENQLIYQEKLSHAQLEADQMIKSAAETAGKRGNEIVSEAQDKAQHILQQAQNEAQLEKKKSQAQMKGQIADVSALLAEKLLGRNIKAADQHELIDDFIKEMDADGRDQ